MYGAPSRIGGRVVGVEHMSGLHGLFEALDGVDAYRELRSRLSAHAPQTARATMLEAAKPYVIAALWQHSERPLLVICPRPEDARQLVERIEAYCGDDAPIHHFAESEVSPYERLALDTATLHPRIAALGSLHPAHAAQPPLVVASAMALMQRTLGAEALDAQRERLVVGQRLALDATLERWARMGLCACARRRGARADGAQGRHRRRLLPRYGASCAHRPVGR